MIVFSEVSKVFFNGQYGLQSVSFSIDPGEMVLITGPSGSGKTTLMRLLTKEYPPTSGDITFEDTPLSSIKNSQAHHHRRRIGVVFQDYRLLPELNAWENIALPLSIIGKPQAEIEHRVTDLLELVQLPDKADLFPSELSGGEAQRIGIARALATAPKVIFADEPTGNLDLDNSKTVAHLLRKINELGTTVLLATHDVSVIDYFDKARHLQLEKGQIQSDNRRQGQSHGTSPSSKPKKENASEKTDSEEKHHDATPHHIEKKSPPVVEVEVEEVEVEVESLEEAPKQTKKADPTSKTRLALKLPSISLPFGKKKKSEPASSQTTPEKKALKTVKAEEESEPVVDTEELE